MKKTMIATALSIALLGSGCASVDLKGSMPGFLSGNQSQEQPENQNRIDKKQVAKKAGIGCLFGGAIALLTKNKDKAVAGCAVGAIAGGFLSYREQLNEAREVEAQARQAGMVAKVETKEIANDQGEKTQAMHSLKIEYKASDMERMSAETIATLDKLATLGTKAKNKLTFTFTGKRACSIPMNELEKRGAFEGHIVKDRCGSGENQILITPVPEV